MIGFIKFWIDRIKSGRQSVLCPETHQSIEYLRQTGWQPNFNYLNGQTEKDRKKYYAAAWPKGK